MASIKNTPKEFIIDDETLQDPAVKDMLFLPKVNGEIKGAGMYPRDYKSWPESMYQIPDDSLVIPESEWDARYEEEEKEQSSIEHVRNTGANGQMIPSLDQDGQGFCWMYGATMALMLLRALANMPYVRLSGHSAACRVKNFRDEGGWCGLAAKWLREFGINTVAEWPEKSMSRQYDTPENREKAKSYRVIEDVMDLRREVYDQKMTKLQIATALFLKQPVQMDFNWWGHDVCGIRWCRIEAGSWGPKIINSWTDQWGNRGTAILRGERSIANGAVAYRVAGRAA